MFTKVDTTPKEAVAQAQRLIKLFKPETGLAVDGVVGPKTLDAYKSLPSKAVGLVNELLVARNEQALRALTEPRKVVAQGNWIPEAQVLAYVRAAVRKYGEIHELNVSAESYLTFLLSLEPKKTITPDGVFYDADSANGPYVGLFQIGPDAFSDVQRTNLISGLPSFGVAARDPMTAPAVALIYSQKLVQYLRRGDPRGVPPVPGYTGVITKEILYGAHNQGAVGLLSGAVNALVQRKQSTKAITVIAQAVQSLRA